MGEKHATKFTLMAGRRSDYKVSLSVQCDLSRLTFFEAEMSLEEFALLVTGMVVTGVKGEVSSLARVGMTHEVKTEVVPFDCFKRRADEEAKMRALAPFEVDGWLGTTSDLTNSHRRTGDKGQSVTFHRWVEPKEDA